MDLKRFYDLPSLEMDQISEEQFVELARRIRQVHGIAYGWYPEATLTDCDLGRLMGELLKVAAPNRVRSAIQGLVTELDDNLENASEKPAVV